MFYFWARGLSGFSYQIAAVAVGWQVYALSRSAFDLGIVGSYIFAAVAVFGAASAFESPAAAALLPGVGFVRHNPAIFGTTSTRSVCRAAGRRDGTAAELRP